MGATDLVRSLMADGVELSTDGERIRWRSAGGWMTPERIAELASAKAEVIAFLTGMNGRSGDVSGEVLDRYEERAAICEHDAGQSRSDAEAVAEATGGRPKETGATTEPVFSARPPARKLEIVCCATDPQTLLGYLCREGPQTNGAAATALGWGATRAWRAEAGLKAAGLVRIGEFGQMVPGASRLSAKTEKVEAGGTRQDRPCIEVAEWDKTGTCPAVSRPGTHP
jgi:hypothetical protein